MDLPEHVRRNRAFFHRSHGDWLRLLRASGFVVEDLVEVRPDDFVILKLLAAVADRRRRARDLADVQFALEAFAGRAGTRLSVPAVRARLRDLYGLQGQRLKDVVATFRLVARPARR